MNGMDEDDDEFPFSDDTLDNLPDSTLLELEESAVRSTQPAPLARSLHAEVRQRILPATLHKQNAPVRPQAKVSAPATGWNNQPQAQPPIGQFDYENYDGHNLGDENVGTPVEERETFVPQRIPGKQTQREEWRQERYSRPNVQLNQANPQPLRKPIHGRDQPPVQHDNKALEQSYDTELQDSMLLDDYQTSKDNGTSSVAEVALRAHIEELNKQILSTKSTMLTQRGEIAIIRANQTKESKVLDRQISALQKTIQDEAEKHKAKIQELNEQAQKIATENKFLKQDLAEVADKNRGLQRTLKERPPSDRIESHKITPQKVPAHSLRDGFDDGELILMSPSKSGRKSKGGTPTTRGNRKRKADVQSPVPPLVLRPSSAPAPLPPKEPNHPPNAERIVPVIRKDYTAERNLQFVQRILNHTLSGEKDRMVEAFMKYKFPSDSSKSFTSIILEASARLSGKRLPADLLQAFIELLAKSLEEKYYKPIKSLLDVINFIIALNPAVLDARTMKILLPVLQSSGEINGVARFEYSPVAHQNFGQFRQIPQAALNHEVNGTECLEMLYSVSCTCADDDEKIELFWRSMSTDFVLMMLNSSQPVSDITLMLNLLSTSILPNTFGNICGTQKQQEEMETYIVERVCYLLWEVPRVDEDVPTLTKAEICTLRLEAMNLLNDLGLASSHHPHDSTSHHGSALLARHPSAIARLVRCIYDEVDAMYLHSPCYALHAKLANQGVRLLYGVLKLHGDSIDLQRKLSAINGGVHKHRVVLTRLAFGERFFLDAEIRDETVSMALEMLEEVVTPEEADALVEAFPAFRKRRAVDMQD